MKNKMKDILLQNRFWKSIDRGGIPLNDWVRNRILGLGLINFALFVILNITGILLMFYYIPDTGKAYQSVKDLEYVVSFGRIMRNMHRWSAFLMIISVFLHMCRVFYTAEYRAPREFNWVIGMLLFLLTLAAGLTGYILLWDQKAYWGATILSNVAGAAPVLGEKLRFVALGGNTVDQNTLSRFYTMHVKILPLLMGLLIVAHFWRIRSDDAAAPLETYASHLSHDPDSDGPITTWADIAQRELGKVLFVLALIMAASVLFDAPLEEMATPSVTPNPTKAIWFFVGLQEMLSWGAPFWWAIVVPNAAIVLLILIPYIERGQVGTGVWFHPSRRIQNILFTAFVTILLGLMITGQFLRGPGWIFYWPWQPWPLH